MVSAPAANADVFGSLDGGSPASGQYLVKFAAGTSEAEQAAALADAGATDLSYVAPLRLHSILLTGGDTQAALDQLSANPTVARVETEQTRSANAVPSDPAFSSQWSLERIGWDQVYGSVSPSGSATVAVLDTGVDAGHPDLASNVLPGTSMLDPGANGTSDPNGHGTEMAGIVAASTDNGEGMAGIGYAGVTVMPVTVLDGQGVGQDGDIVGGVIWAADHGADVILMAFSSPDFSPSLQEAIDYAWSKGAVLVGAAGNDGSSAAHFPAGDRGVVGVANTDVSDALNASTNYGDAAFIAAPGTGIHTTAGDGGYVEITGTSASAAVVAGSAALIRASSPGASNGTIVSRLARSADPIVNGGTGNGRLNLARAIGDLTTDELQPAGAAPVGEGGPFVGPYTIAANVISRSVAGNWNVATTWAASARTGSITTSTASSTVTGSGTLFQTELAPGDALYRADGTTLIGTVATITNNTSLTLTANALNNNAGVAYSSSRVPGAGDSVSITGGSTITIPVSYAAQALSVDINPGNTNNGTTLSLAAGSSSLTIVDFLNLNRPGNNNTTQLNVGAGSVAVGGNLTLAGTATQGNRINRLSIGTGSVQVAQDLIFVTGNIATNLVDMSPGGLTGGTLNLGRAFTVNTTTNVGTLNPANGTVNFNGTAAQTIPIGVSAVVYNNLHVNNTAGATLSAAVSAANVTGSLRVQTGTLNNGGFAVVGGGSPDVFEVADGATFRATGTSTVPSGFGSRTYGATSTVDYNGSPNQTVGAESYGHLSLTGSGTKTAGGLITVRGDWTLNAGASFAPAASTVTFSGGAATQTIGGTIGTTFANLTINKSAGNVALARDENVAGALTFTSGNVTTGANVLVATGNTVNHTSGHVVGNLRRAIPTGSPSVRFDVGSGADYTPANLELHGRDVSRGTVTATTTASEHPNIASSGIDSSKSVNRYWTLTPGGGLAFASYNGTFTFVPGDVDGGANTGNFVVRRHNGTNWLATTTGTRTATSTQATGLTAMSDFAVGEPDATGPIASDVAVSPTPTNVPPTVTASVSDATTGGGNIAAAEYFVDSVGSPGTGNAMSPVVGAFDSPTEAVTATLTPAVFNALSEGSHTVYVRGTDVAGNWGATDSATFVKDTTGPDTDITFPEDGAAYNEAGWNAGCPTPGLCGTAVDAAGVDSVQVSIQRQSDGKYWDGTTWDPTSETYLPAAGTTSWSFPLDASALTDGDSYTVHAISTDDVGNESSVVSVTFSYDVTAPDVTVEQAAGQDDPTNTQPIHFTAEFSELVSGFGAEDVTLGGTADSSLATVTVTAITSTSFDIAVEGLGSDGTLTVEIPADSAHDARLQRQHRLDLRGQRGHLRRDLAGDRGELARVLERRGGDDPGGLHGLRLGRLRPEARRALGEEERRRVDARRHGQLAGRRRPVRLHPLRRRHLPLLHDRRGRGGQPRGRPERGRHDDAPRHGGARADPERAAGGHERQHSRGRRHGGHPGGGRVALGGRRPRDRRDPGRHRHGDPDALRRRGRSRRQLLGRRGPPRRRRLHRARGAVRRRGQRGQRRA